MCFYYGYLNFIVGMKLRKYNLCYNTRDLIKSLAENTNDRNKINILLLNQVNKISHVDLNTFLLSFIMNS